MKETLEALNISHVTTSFYHPQSNSKVERFHRTLHDVLSKLIDDNVDKWDLFLNQALAAVRFNVSESSKFSPSFLLYNRDVVLPLDNLLQPRRRYHGEEMHRIALENQNKTFLTVYKHIKQAKRRQAKYADRQSHDKDFKVGDTIFYKNYNKATKLQSNWRYFFRIIEKKGPVSFIIKDQLSDRTIKAHADQIHLAPVDEWEIPKDKLGRNLRKTNYVVPPEASESSNSEPESSHTTPIQKIVKRKRQERDTSDEEDDIHLMELAKRLKERHAREADVSRAAASNSTDGHDTVGYKSSDNETVMSINHLKRKKVLHKKNT